MLKLYQVEDVWGVEYILCGVQVRQYFWRASEAIEFFILKSQEV